MHERRIHPPPNKSSRYFQTAIINKLQPTQDEQVKDLLEREEELIREIRLAKERVETLQVLNERLNQIIIRSHTINPNREESFLRRLNTILQSNHRPPSGDKKRVQTEQHRKSHQKSILKNVDSQNFSSFGKDKKPHLRSICDQNNSFLMNAGKNLDRRQIKKKLANRMNCTEGK